MSDDLDDDMSLDDSFDDFEKKGNTLGDLWRNNPLFKIGALVGGAILIFLVISVMGGEDSAPLDPSVVGAAPDIKSVPGTEEASPAYVQAIEELNEAEIERAMNEGDSALPVPIEPPVGVVSLPEVEEQEEDPLQRWRRLQEERLEREIQQREAAVIPDNTADVERQEAVAQLAETLAQQMSSILGAEDQTQVSSINMTSPDFLEQLAAAEAEEEAEILAAEAEMNEDLAGELLLPAGEVLYAQLLTEANSDVPGPVLAEVLQGPLKGSRVLGTFEVQNELLTLTFDTVVYEEESVSIDAVALDPETTLPGLATEVDQRYLTRVILPAAAAFVQGMASAISESGRTNVTVEGDTVAEETEETDTDQEAASGIEEAGQEIGTILDDIASETEVLVRIAAGTGIGLLFIEPVIVGEEGVQ